MDAVRPDDANDAAALWLREAEAVLVCAGAGMSVDMSKDTNVYVRPSDFAKHYPGLLKYGYSTAYECMGLGGDPKVPGETKWAYLALHMHLQRFLFEPVSSYATVLELCRGKDTFVWTSNVDGCFKTAGFDQERIYTPQGDWEWLQCSNGCTAEVWASQPIVEEVLKSLDRENTTLRDPSVIPKCTNCGARLGGNVRGGDWFIHQHYEAAQDRAIEFVRKNRKSRSKMVILEIGAGFNTPMVTRWPMESIARDTGAPLIRINPTDAHVPLDISAVGIERGWEVLGELNMHVDGSWAREAVRRLEHCRTQTLFDLARRGKVEQWRIYKDRLGHFDWEKWLANLRR